MKQVSDRGELRIDNVVVGVDGSAESLSALEWAADAAGTEGVVHAVAAIPPALELAVAAAQYDSAKLVDHTRHDLESWWVADVRDRGHHVVCDVIEDDPADALLRTAHDVDADLIVVGVHAKPPLAPRTVGRVTNKLIHKTDIALVVVDDGAPPGFGDGPTVVAGAGHGEATRAAIDFAARYSERCGTALTLVRAVPHRPVFGTDGLLDVAAFYIDPNLLFTWATDDLIELADEIQGSTASELKISPTVRAGEPGPRLVEAGTGASLLVIGRHQTQRDHSPIQRTLHHVITHAPCPVVIVPPPDDPD